MKPAPPTNVVAPDAFKLVPKLSKEKKAEARTARQRVAKRMKVNRTVFVRDWMDGVLTMAEMSTKFGLSYADLRKLAEELGVTQDIQAHTRRLTELKLAAAQMADAIKAGAPSALDNILDAKAEANASAEIDMRNQIAKASALLDIAFAEIAALSNPDLVKALSDIASKMGKDGKSDDSVLHAITAMLASTTLASRLKLLDVASAIQERVIALRRTSIGLMPTKPSGSDGKDERRDFEELIKQAHIERQKREEK